MGAMNRAEIIRAARFVVFNGVGTVIDIALVTVLSREFGAPPLLAIFCGWTSNMITGVLMNRYLVFANGQSTFYTATWRYIMLVTFNLGVGVFGVAALVSAGWPYVPTRLLSSTLLVVTNYFVARSWVFAVRSTSGADLANEVHVIAAQHAVRLHRSDAAGPD
jgi:putative flippase GtrA